MGGVVLDGAVGGAAERAATGRVIGGVSEEATGATSNPPATHHHATTPTTHATTPTTHAPPTTPNSPAPPPASFSPVLVLGMTLVAMAAANHLSHAAVAAVQAEAANEAAAVEITAALGKHAR